MFGQPGHFCFLIFAQGTWKESFKQKIIKKAKSEFKSRVYWDPMFDIPVPLFDPNVLDGENESCKVCKELYPLFKEKLGDNQGLIYFGHKALLSADIKEFLNVLFNEKEIKKVFLLILDNKSFVIGANIRRIMDNITSRTIKKSELFNNIDEEKLEYSLFYEIMRDRYY